MKENQFRFCAFVFLFLQFIYLPIKGQINEKAIDQMNKSYIGEDIKDIYNKITRKKRVDETDTVGLEQGRVVVNIVPAVGYSLSTGFAAIVSSNIVFKRPNANLSSFILAPNITSRSQILLPIRGSVWTKNNRYNLVSDWRLMKYPQSTFGLGSNTHLDNEIPMDYSYLRIYQTIYRKIKGSFYGGIGFHFDYHWNITADLPEGMTHTNLFRLGLASKSNSTGYSFNFLFDNRASSLYPEKGLYVNANLRFNKPVFGSDYKSTTLIVDARKYIKLSSKNDNVLAFWGYEWLTLKGQVPFLDLPSTGWDMYNNTARGYIQGRLRGFNFVYAESEYRFNITKNKLIGGVVFLNAQTVTKEISYQFQKVLPGAGVGIRIKINKMSHTNLGLDYGFGTEGSRGFFVNLGEVF